MPVNWFNPLRGVPARSLSPLSAAGASSTGASAGDLVAARHLLGVSASEDHLAVLAQQHPWQQQQQQQQTGQRLRQRRNAVCFDSPPPALVRLTAQAERRRHSLAPGETPLPRIGSPVIASVAMLTTAAATHVGPPRSATLPTPTRHRRNHSLAGPPAPAALAAAQMQAQAQAMRRTSVSSVSSSGSSSALFGLSRSVSPSPRYELLASPWRAMDSLPEDVDDADAEATRAHQCANPSLAAAVSREWSADELARPHKHQTAGSSDMLDEADEERVRTSSRHRMRRNAVSLGVSAAGIAVASSPTAATPTDPRARRNAVCPDSTELLHMQTLLFVRGRSGARA